MAANPEVSRWQADPARRAPSAREPEAARQYCYLIGLPGRCVYHRDRQSRLPAPSYTSPALGVALKDKSGEPSRESSFIVIISGWPDAGQRYPRIEDTMSRDLIKVAIRKRMAETGEPYCLARRRVLARQDATKRSIRLADAFATQPAPSVLQRQVQHFLRLAAEAVQLHTRSAMQPAISAYQQQVQEMTRLAAEAVQLHTRSAMQPAISAYQQQVQEMTRLAAEAAQLHTGQAGRMGAAMRGIDRD
jgi:hypothetical protein